MAGWAFLRRFFASMDIAAIIAFPEDLPVLDEDLVVFDSVIELVVAILMAFFDHSDELEGFRNFRKTYFFRHFREGRIKIRPLFVFPSSRGLEIVKRIPERDWIPRVDLLHRPVQPMAQKMLVKDLGMFFFVIRRLLKNSGDLRIAFLHGHRSIIVITHPGLGLTRE